MRNSHVDELLARASDEKLTGDEEDRTAAHLATCERCRRLARDLERIAPLFIGTRANIEPRPALPLAPRRSGFSALFAFGVVVATVVGALIIGVGLQSLRASQEAAGPRPGPVATQPVASSTQSVSTANPLATKGAKLLVGEHTITGTVPGGGSVLTGSFSGFVLRDATGAALLSHDATGSGVGTPTFDGSHRLAYWSRTDASGTATYQLRVWDLVEPLHKPRDVVTMFF
jgi:hypothetical protein